MTFGCAAGQFRRSPAVRPPFQRVGRIRALAGGRACEAIDDAPEGVSGLSLDYRQLEWAVADSCDSRGIRQSGNRSLERRTAPRDRGTGRELSPTAKASEPTGNDLGVGGAVYRRRCFVVVGLPHVP